MHLFLNYGRVSQARLNLNDKTNKENHRVLQKETNIFF